MDNVYESLEHRMYDENGEEIYRDHDKVRKLIEEIQKYREGDKYLDTEYTAFMIARHCVELRIDEMLVEKFFNKIQIA